MKLKEIMERLAQIRAALEDDEEVDVEALENEVACLQEERAKIEDHAQRRMAMLEGIATGEIPTTDLETTEETQEEEKEERKMNKEYRNAYFKRLMGRKLNEAEERAFTHTTENTAAVIPEETANKIYSAMEELHPILADINKVYSGAVMRIIKHTAIVAGDAKKVAEGSANDDEQNTFVNVTLSGEKFSKHVKISFELEHMAVDAFEDYLIKEISNRLASAVAADVVASIKSGVAEGNKATTQNLTIADILGALGKVKAPGRVFVYANRATIFGNIYNLSSEQGTLNFLADYNNGISGNLLGHGIKQEDAVPDGEILILAPNDYLHNVIAPVTFFADRDAPTGDKVIAGHTIVGGSLVNDTSAAVVTVGEEAPGV